MITDEEIAELERICFEATNDFETPRAEVSFELNVIAVIERLRAAERDAKRYQWLMNPTFPVSIEINGEFPFSIGSVIDTAIAEQEKS